MSSSKDALSAERLRDIKGAINEFLSQSNVYDGLRDIIDTYVTEKESKSPGSPCDVEDVMTIMRERGVVQQLMTQLSSNTPLSTGPAGCGGTLAQPDNTVFPALVEGQHYLHVRMLGGRAFLDSMDMSPSHMRPLRLFAAVHFGLQRGESAHLPISTDPRFDDDFVFHVDPAFFGYGPDDLIQVAVPLVVAVFREDTRENIAELVGENIIDWRRVLKAGAVRLTVELSGRSASVPVGIVDIELQMLPPHSVRHTEDEIASHIDDERSVTTTADREFLVYARRWWAEYQNVRSSHRGRKVKLFTALSNGRMVPVTHFVSPTQADYGIESPLDAARFVSLFKNTQHRSSGLSLLSDASIGSSGGCEQWLSLFAFLSQRQGHPCNHAALLCSLLLGFGLDAYCCIGAQELDKTGVCVITRAKGCSGAYTVTVWNPTTGARTAVNGAHPFVTADCMFNHRAFFANIQAANRILTTSFDIHNEEFWKPIVTLKLRNLPRFPVAPLLSTPALTHTDERSLEMGVRARIELYRDGIGLHTLYNDDISYTLAQALHTYEQQRVVGDDTMGFCFFESCVKGILGAGKTFKAIPVNVTHTNDQEIVNTIRGSAAGKEILDTVADTVHFGLRIKIFSFPEHVLSVWVMLAVAYHSTQTAPS